jgi:hypothetical protein
MCSNASDKTSMEELKVNRITVTVRRETGKE